MLLSHFLQVPQRVIELHFDGVLRVVCLVPEYWALIASSQDLPVKAD